MAIDITKINYIQDGETAIQQVLNRPTKDLVTQVDSEISTLDTNLKQYADSGDSTTLSSAKSYTDSEISTLDTSLKSYSDTNDGISSVSVTGDGNSSVSVTVTGNDGSTASNSTSTSHNHDGRYYTETEIDNMFQSNTPPGGIILWSGSISNIPSGWALCDGNNGTPNLQNRFVVGAGGAYAVGGKGGSKDAVVVSHNHSGSTDTDGYHSHSGSTSYDGNHRHISQISTKGINIDGSSLASNHTNRTRATNITDGRHPYTDYSGNHNHSISINGNGNHSHSLNINSTGESGTDKNLPPYYALAYIMKL